MIDATSDTGEKPEGGPGAVRLVNVDFSYPTRPDIAVFRKFNLDVAPGKVTALVGESGSGKSTIVSLIERFYDVQKGHVFLDGVDVRQLSLPWLRGRVRLLCHGRCSAG
jgi:ATP-binding cassette, subfamily B (MDR/TAP), member 1